MLELRAGELGILPVPADFLGDPPGESDGPGNAATLRGVMSKKSAKDLIEKALRQGKQIQAKVGAGKDGVDWKMADIEMKASLAGEEGGFSELLVESSSGAQTWKHSVQLGSGTCAVLRYPSGESVLIVTGRSSPVGGVTKEEP